MPSRVRCKFCSHEKGGLCTKKTTRGFSPKVRVNKPRSCDLYSEDALRVLSDFRKREAHKGKLRSLKSRGQ